jgi:hypothetical protein
MAQFIIEVHETHSARYTVTADTLAAAKKAVADGTATPDPGSITLVRRTVQAAAEATPAFEVGKTYHLDPATGHLVDEDGNPPALAVDEAALTANSRQARRERRQAAKKATGETVTKKVTTKK